MAPRTTVELVVLRVRLRLGPAHSRAMDSMVFIFYSDELVINVETGIVAK
jgi:hypothetical protein